MAATRTKRRSFFALLKPLCAHHTRLPAKRRPCLEELEVRAVPTVTAVNESFVAMPQTPTSLNLLQQDTAASNQPVTLLSLGSVSPSGPTLTRNADGSLSFTSADTGTFTFDQTISGAMQEVAANDGAINDNLGDSVAISGNTAAVGAAAHKVGSNGFQGAVYVFELGGATWSLQQELTAADGGFGDEFGASVALDGNVLAVGAIQHTVGNNASQGAAYVYTFSGTTWSQQQELTAGDGAADDEFGFSVSLSADTLVVGAPSHGVSSNARQGAAYIYTRTGSLWSQQQELTAADGGAHDQFGTKVALSGNTIVVGARNHEVGANAGQGAVYVYTLAGSTWSQQQELTADDGAANDAFGAGAAINGNTIVVGAFNHQVGTSAGQGSVYVYTLAGFTWNQQQEVTAADGAAGDNFGESVALDGNTLLIGAGGHHVGTNAGQGAAYEYKLANSTWSLQQELTAADGVANAFFGVSVAVSGDIILVGANGQTVGGNNDQGSAYFQNVSMSSAPVTVIVAAFQPAQLQFSTANLHVSRAAGSALLTLVRTGGLSGNATVQYATQDGTAHTGTDYTKSIGTLTFTPGVIAQTLSIPILDDQQDQGNETFTLILSSPTGGASLASPSIATVTINDPLAANPMPGNLALVASQFTHSVESYSLFITNAYNHYLKRNPDAGGLAFWISAMQAGGTDEQLEASFLSSTEYISAHGGTGSAWVTGMYEDLLGRAPDLGGLAYWTNVLASGGSAFNVAYGFAAGAEREGQRIAADYEIYLGRQLDASGQAYWVNQFLAGARNEDVVAGFIGSAEFYQNLSKGQNNETAWIDSAFDVLLHRDPGPNELANWLAQLQ